MLEGRYVDVLRQSPLFDDAAYASASLDDWVQHRFDAIADKDTNNTQYSLFLTAVAALNVFVQINWTGPLVDQTIFGLLNIDDEDQQRSLHQQLLSDLSVDSEPVYHLVEQLGYLAIALSVLKRLGSSLLTVDFWARRATFIQQQLLDECTGTLQDRLEELTKTSAQRMQLDQDRSLRVRHELETALIYSYFGQDKDAFDKMKQAQQSSGFQWSLTGALGKRTKFQTFDVTQLVILAESEQSTDNKEMAGSAAGNDTSEEAPRPETLDLNDDTLLEKIAFTSEKDADKRQGNLQVIDQCLLLAFCMNVKNTNPDHGLTIEEMVPYVTRVLENANNWMVHTMGLLLRSRLEAHKSRTVERSALQLQALVDQIKLDEHKEDGVAGASDRLSHFYDLLLPSKWEMERELARRFVSLGVLRSALEIFERLEMWEDVVSCYQLLEQAAKAKQVVQNLLNDDPNSPKLWCIMGDLDGDPVLWQKSWDLSGQRYARAMRSLGAYYFKKDDHNKCIECYDKALSINPLFEGSWYVMGCAAMLVERWDVGVRAFQRVVNLDNEQAEAWNNLASIYSRTDRKMEAFLALKQASKLKFDNWKIWNNLLLIAVDVGQFADAMWAMQRVVDLRWDKVRDQAVDLQVLQMIVESVIQNWPDVHNQDGRRLSRQVQRLLEDVILSRITNSPNIWRITSKFYIWQQRTVDALDAYQKAYRAALHANADLETDLDSFNNVADWALETVDMYESLGPKERPDGTPVCSDWKYQSKQLLKSLMGKVRDVFDDSPSYERLHERLEDLKAN
ncbi:TPR-like protein [Hesseltinella vesiculosa]|uniref:TPR-like protein n=1 Tax=Hesseltinella vesiculosa TaxID=101127 RepID=A0A1X2G831_9FUNG|nr:TPR-like protein [Hesseltinella vesiculosa]